MQCSGIAKKFQPTLPLSSLACVQTCPLYQKKSGEETTVNRRTVVNRVPVSQECWGKPLTGCNVNAMTQIISGVVIGERISE